MSTDELYYMFVGVDVLGDPYGHKVTFASERTVGDACPYKYIIPYDIGEAFRLPRFVGVDVLDDPSGRKLTFLCECYIRFLLS